MKILALDTATKTGALALTDDDDIISETPLDAEVTHSETLLPAMRRMLNASGVTLGEISLFALTAGPGSFTGVRIGVSTVKGFAFALGKPVAGVSTLEAMAYNAAPADMIITPVMDARRGEVYTADFRWKGERLERVSPDRALPPEALLQSDREKTCFLGDGLVKAGPMLREGLGERALFAPPAAGLVRGSVIARLALEKYRQGEVLQAATFTPAYLRRSEAEIKREKGLL